MIQLLLIISVSSGSLDVIDGIDSMWLADGWEITDSVSIDPFDYVERYLYCSPTSDITTLINDISCRAFFNTTENGIFWRTVIGGADGIVILQEDQDQPLRIPLQDGLGVTYSSKNGYYAIAGNYNMFIDFRNGLNTILPDIRSASYDRLPSYIISSDGKVAGLKHELFYTYDKEYNLISSRPFPHDAWMAYADHDCDGNCVVFIYSTTENNHRYYYLAGMSWSGDLIWETKFEHGELASFEPCVSNDGSVVAVKFFHDGIHIFNGNNGSLVKTIFSGLDIHSFCLSPDGSFIAGCLPSAHTGSGHNDDDVVLYDLNSDITTIIDCRSSQWFSPAVYKVANGGSVLFSCIDKIIRSPSSERKRIRRMCVADSDGRIVWASSPFNIWDRTFTTSYNLSYTRDLRRPEALIEIPNGFRVAYQDIDSIEILTIENTSE